ncbi:MAG: NAD(P)-binding protein, partial [Candidatus Adiutrix sp.]|nr:NAD(P)-binding protein [Candidatus Adiutrix sp.]
RLEIIDERDHVAGNCHTLRDQDTGIMLHAHGAHIFHTDNENVWSFVNRFGEFEPYPHKVKTVSRGLVYSLPLNLLTINQFFGLALSPGEAAAHLRVLSDQTITDPGNFEEQALAFLGEELYRAFFYGYTKKQWGREPRELPAGLLSRLPVRFNYDDGYFNSRHQAVPRLGYTALVEKMLDHPDLKVRLETVYDDSMRAGYDHIFYTGPLDRFFDFAQGRLPYRTLDFERFDEEGDHQGCAVMNYADPEIPYTRIIEHKHFSVWENFKTTVCFREKPRECLAGDIPYYPISFAGDNALLNRYQSLAALEKNMTFAGRLGGFKYLDMDAAVAEGLRIADNFARDARLA